MKYWVLKGRPADNNWNNMLVPGNAEVWHTAKPPTTWQVSDRLLCWESSPGLRLVGLAELSNAHVRINDEGETLFEVKYLTRILQSAPTIDELREIPVVKDASFLKSGPATTLQSISFEQAMALIRLVHGKNPELEPVWQDVDLNVYGSLIPDLDMTVSGREGQKKLVHHFLRERDRRIVDLKKKAVLEAHGQLICDACSFSFEDFYGSRGHDFCEVHHLIPLSEIETDSETRLEDLAILCSNCHRMIHQQPWMKIEELKRIIRTHAQRPIFNGQF